MISPLTWLLHLSVSWGLAILIWVIQLVHYPAFLYIDSTRSKVFHQMHTGSIVLITMPLMLVELGISAWSCWEMHFDWWWLVPLISVLLIWYNTFLVQIPLHSKLAENWSKPLIKRLIQNNWWRTVLWTFKAIWLSGLFYSTMS